MSSKINITVSIHSVCVCVLELGGKTNHVSLYRMRVYKSVCVCVCVWRVVGGVHARDYSSMPPVHMFKTFHGILICWFTKRNLYI